MFSRLFVDTSYVLALFNSSDEYHQKALKLKYLTKAPVTLYTTEAVLLEVGNSLSRVAFRGKCVEFINGFYSTKNMVVEPVTTALIKEALSFFGSRPDKEWGLVDCLSFLVMKKYGVRSALTADDHFVQAGFRALLLE